MEVRIKTTDYSLTPDVKEYLEERLLPLQKLLGADEPVARCEVELGRAAGRPRHGANLWFAEMQIMYPGQALIRATNNAETITAAIDDVKEEVERQLRRARKFHIRFLRRGGASVKRMLRLG